MKKEETKIATELEKLKRKNHRQKMFLLLTVLQLSTVAISYYLGRSHK